MENSSLEVLPNCPQLWMHCQNGCKSTSFFLGLWRHSEKGFKSNAALVRTLWVEKSNKSLLHNQERKQQPTQTQLSRFEKCFRKNYLKIYMPNYNKYYFMQDLATLQTLQPDDHHANTLETKSNWEVYQNGWCSCTPAILISFLHTGSAVIKKDG